MSTVPHSIPFKHVLATFKGERVYLSFTLIGSTLLLQSSFEPIDLDPDEAKDVAQRAGEDEDMFDVSVEDAR